MSLRRILIIQRCDSILHRYLLLAKESQIEIYATSTSTLVRSMSVGYQNSISGFSFSTANPNILFLSTFSGAIWKLDWIEARKLASWEVSSRITGLATAQSTSVEDDVVFTIETNDKRGRWMITAHKLNTTSGASEPERSTLYESRQPISGLRVMEGGRTLLATSGNHLMMGVRSDTDSKFMASVTYTWREVLVTERITCFDVRVATNLPQSGSTTLEKVKHPKSSPQSSFDIVVGNVKGEVYIYRDFLDRLIEKEGAVEAGKSVDIAGSLHHWHRQAVKTVKWSLDGKP